MLSTAEHLAIFSVKTLQPMARDLGLTGVSKLRKADLVAAIVSALDIVHAEAEAYASDVAAHTANADIKSGGFWNCCANKPAKVIVWDEGSRQIVCASCASQYRGEVQELQPGKAVTCECCGNDYWQESDDAIEAPMVAVGKATDGASIVASEPFKLDHFRKMAIHPVKVTARYKRDRQTFRRYGIGNPYRGIHKPTALCRCAEVRAWC